MSKRLSVASVLALALLAPTARAAPDPKQNAKPLVEILIAVAENGHQAAVRDSLRRALQNLPTNLTFTAAPAIAPHDVVTAEVSPGTIAKVWIDLRSPNTATVYVTDGRTVFERQLRLEQGLDSLGLDLLDVVVATSVETVLAGGQVGMSREEFTRSLSRPTPSVAAPAPTTTPVPGAGPPPAAELPTRSAPFSSGPGPGPAPAPASSVPPVVSSPASPPSPVPPGTNAASRSADQRTLASDDSSLTLRAAVIYEGLLVAATKTTQGPGLQVEGQISSIRFGVGFHGHFPYEVARTEETLRLAPESFRLFVGRVFSLRPKVTFLLSLGAGMDITNVRATSTEADIAATDAGWWADPVVRPLAQIERRFGDISAGAAVGADVDIRGSEYVVKTVPGEHPIWTPWRIRPVAVLTCGYVF